MQQDIQEKLPYKRKKRNKNSKLKYFYLFTFVFLITLWILLSMVKSYSPDVDVAIGNQEPLTLRGDDLNYDSKPIDERLKWIQMEDQMPSVALRESEKDDENNFYEESDDTIFSNDFLAESKSEKKLDSNSDKAGDLTKKLSANEEKQKTPIVPLPVHSVTKVYLGNFSNLEDAVVAQNKIAFDEPAVVPFVKSVGSQYIVQVGSFVDSEKAEALMKKLREKGYSPKILYEN